MHMLVAAATPTEVEPFVATLGDPDPRSSRISSYIHAGHHIDILITGVGMVAMATWCSRALMKSRYDLALNLGVCGSFNRAHAPGRVVHVIFDRFAELGAESGDAFLTVQDLELVGMNEFPFIGGELANVTPPPIAALTQLPGARGITVNTAHGNARTIGEVTARFQPDVESMEGAGFMYACLAHGLAFAQIRAVSNVVEPRNRAAWKLPEAIQALAGAAVTIVEQA
jgi:futalosine hydrolase